MAKVKDLIDKKECFKCKFFCGIVGDPEGFLKDPHGLCPLPLSLLEKLSLTLQG